MKTLYEDDIIPTGKYKGMTIKHVAGKDMNYIKRFNKEAHPGRNNYCISEETLSALTATDIKTKLESRNGQNPRVD